MFTYTNNTFSFFFTGHAANWTEAEDAGETPVMDPFFLTDIILMDYSTDTSVDIIEMGFYIESPFYEDTHYVPGQNTLLPDTTISGWYYIEVLEYNYGYRQTSYHFIVTDTVPPTPLPTLVPSTHPSVWK